MDRMLLSKRVALLLLLIFLSSCWLAKDESLVEDQFYDLSESTCKVEAKNFAKIFEKDISKDLECLRSSLNDFSSKVKRPDETVISRNDIEKFINKFYQDTKHLILNKIGLFYKVIGLLLGDSFDKVDVKKINDIVDSLKDLNYYGKEFRNLYKLTILPVDELEDTEAKKKRRKENSKRYFKNRTRLHSYIDQFVSRLIKRTRRYSTYGHNVEIDKILIDAYDFLRTETNSNPFDFKDIQSFYFLKKLFVGGESSKLVNDEGVKLVKKAGPLAKHFLDIVNVVSNDFEQRVDKDYFILELIRKLRGDFVFHKTNTLILEHENLITMLKLLAKDIDWDLTSNSIKNFKERILGGDREEYTYGDINSIVDTVKEGVEFSFFNRITYAHFSEVLESTQVGEETLKLPSLREYQYFSTTRIKEMWNNFLFIAKSYHFFLSDDGLLYMDYELNRNNHGFNFLSVTRWILKKFFVAYGHTSSKEGGEFVLSLPEMRTIATQYKGALEELNLWPDDLERLLTELELGSDLFRYNSNGDKSIQQDELNEFVSVLVQSDKVGKEINEKFSFYCPVVGYDDRDNPTYAVECYRKNFFNVMFRKIKYARNFKNLYKWYTYQKNIDLIEFLKSIEIKARLINDPERPITKTDLSRIVTSLTNIETLVVTHDKNRNSTIEGKEITSILKVVEKTVAAGSEGSLEPGTPFMRSTFLFVLKHLRKPQPLEFLRFHFLARKKNITADRMNSAVILSLF